MCDVNAFDTWLCFYRLQLGNHKMYAHSSISLVFYCYAPHATPCNFDCMSFRWNSKWNTVQFNYILKIAALFYTTYALFANTFIHSFETKIAFCSRSHFFYRIFIGGSVVKRLDFDESSGNLKKYISIALHSSLWFSLLWQCMSASMPMQHMKWWKPVKIPTFLIVLTFYFIPYANAYSTSQSFYACYTQYLQYAIACNCFQSFPPHFDGNTEVELDFW